VKTVEQVYEAPTLIEVGAFTEMTAGTLFGGASDGGYPPYDNWFN
jgi:hypothetical protein